MLPGFTAADAVTRPSGPRPVAEPALPVLYIWPDTIVPASIDGELLPQFAACTPCLGLPSGPWCFTIFGRRICLPIPNIGTWKGCCDVEFRWGWPPVSVANCRVQRCT